MKALLLLALVPLSLEAKAYRIGVDPRVELMSILFRLAGNPEYTQGRVPAYLEAIDRYFGPYRDHDAVRLARQLRQSDGVSFDAVMNLAVHVKDIESLAERVPFDSKQSRLEPRWHGTKARVFLEAARRFVRDSKFTEFIASQKALYEITDRRLRAYVETKADLPWLDRFFGTRPTARFIVVPGLVNGGASYGASLVAEDGVREIYAIPGVWEIDAGGQPVFAGDWIDFLVHEFAHSYCNPLVDAFEPRMAKSGQLLYEPVREAMSRQAYADWKVMLRESLVRASTIRYVQEHQGEAAARRATQAEQARSFLWMEELVALLGVYEGDRKTYPTLESFMPRIVAFFADRAPKAAELVNKRDEARPHVAGMNIANGARNVDPTLTQIVIHFDRAMRKNGYSVIKLDAAKFPRIGRVSFDESGTAFTIPVALEPAHNYEFALNWPGGGNFRSQDGAALEQFIVRFRTAGASAQK